MKIITAPESYDDTETSKLFLAGGITDCPNWQQEAIKLLKDSQWQLLNPRRDDFPIGDPNAAQAQIEWEYGALRAADGILFWFPKETLCPIVLYELGCWSSKYALIFIGVHPKYQRRQDVEIQTKLVRPDIEIVYSLKKLCKQVKDYDI